MQQKRTAPGAAATDPEDGGSFVRFGLFAGAGYELGIADGLSWRVIDARVSFDMGTRRAMDRVGHWVDLGLELSTATAHSRRLVS